MLKSFMTGMIVCHQAMLLKRSCTVTYDLSWRIAADIDWCIGSMKMSKPNTVSTKAISSTFSEGAFLRVTVG